MCVNSVSQGLNVDLPKAGLEPRTSRSESRASTITPRGHNVNEMSKKLRRQHTVHYKKKRDMRGTRFYRKDTVATQTWQLVTRDTHLNTPPLSGFDRV
ncbi:hypothetical protein ElyMa_002154600 [Elysia marginata]|uniref:Uncharacterized protein n=1 Tax=Elysia marginata TaxID=1093978 RepID=A0AAV4FN20_9GAST|nr:hypothetical protein ElyMa_002154600 [Elysia marginata]